MAGGNGEDADDDEEAQEFGDESGDEWQRGVRNE